MADADVRVVTGAFSYTGRHLSRMLLERGAEVRTLTNHPPAGKDAAGIQIYPLRFDRPEEMEEALQGASVFYNTYWIRYPYGGRDFSLAVENSRKLLKACVDAGVRRFVHISIANPEKGAAELPYYSGKLEVEEAVKQSGLSYAIIRPTVLFGDCDILINNIAWFARYFPAFTIPGDGNYRIQPIHVEDLAAVMLEQGERSENVVVDAAGPEAYTFNELLKLLDRKMRSRTAYWHVSPGAALKASSMFAPLLKDQVLTEDELKGLMSDLLVSQQEPLGQTRLSDWLEKHCEDVGMHYRSELKRHYDRE